MLNNNIPLYRLPLFPGSEVQDGVILYEYKPKHLSTKSKKFLATNKREDI